MPDFPDVKVVLSYLEQMSSISEEIDSLHQQIYFVANQAISIPSSAQVAQTRVQKSRMNEAPYVRKLEKKETLEEELRAQLKQQKAIRDQIIRLINRYTRGRENRVLTSRYISGQSWQKMAEEMGLSQKQLRRIRDSAASKLVGASLTEPQDR